MNELIPGLGWLSKTVSHLLTYGTIAVLLSWLSALVGAALTFLIRRDHGYQRSFWNFLHFLFPAEILRNRSCRLDLLFTIATRVVTPLLITPLLITSAAMTQITYTALSNWFGAHPATPESVLIRVLALVGVVVVSDFASFWTHYFDHHVKILWEFHKVHHAARFLIPLTNRRVHPVQELFDDAPLLILAGIWLGLLSYTIGLPIDDNVTLGMDAYFVANLLSFYHLRHSHIPMSYGWLENIFLSPAQHHLHHSFVVRHCDRNFGLLLSCWDKMAGTFLRSEPQAAIKLGLADQYASGYDSVLKLYVTPFINTGRMIGSWAGENAPAGHRVGAAFWATRSLGSDDPDHPPHPGAAGELAPDTPPREEPVHRVRTRTDTNQQVYAGHRPQESPE